MKAPWVLAGLWAVAGLTHAADANDAARGEPGAVAAVPGVTIRRFAVTGNSLLPPETLESILAPYTGSGRDIGDLQRALEALQAGYHAAGYGGVEVRLPEQVLERGIINLVVIEPRLRDIVVEGNVHFSTANVLRSVPVLRTGVTPRAVEIARGVRLANENPAKQTTVVLRSAERDDRIDAIVRVADADPRRMAIRLDNAGPAEPHRGRVGVDFRHANLFDRDHVLRASFVTAPRAPQEARLYGASYRWPLYGSGDSLELVAGHSSVDAGTVADLFTATGRGAVFAARYNRNLARWGELEHTLVFGQEYRGYRGVEPHAAGQAAGGPLTDISVRPFSVTYRGEWRGQGRSGLLFHVAAVTNVPGGSAGGEARFRQVRGGAAASYRLIRAGAIYSLQAAADWLVRARIDGQYTADVLISPEMFPIGGADSVRGFDERHAYEDRGWRATWELYTPDLQAAAGAGGRLRALVFFDHGSVHSNAAPPGTRAGGRLDSGGFGLRYDYGAGFALRFDVAHVFHDGVQATGVASRQGKALGHLSLEWGW